MGQDEEELCIEKFIFGSLMLKKQDFCADQAWDATLKSFYHEGWFFFFSACRRRAPLSEVSGWAASGTIDGAEPLGMLERSAPPPAVPSHNPLLSHTLSRLLGDAQPWRAASPRAARRHSVSRCQNGKAEERRRSGIKFSRARLNMIKQFSVHRSSASALHSGIHCCTLWPTRFHSEESKPRAAGIGLWIQKSWG